MRPSTPPMERCWNEPSRRAVKVAHVPTSRLRIWQSRNQVWVRRVVNIGARRWQRDRNDDHDRGGRRVKNHKLAERLSVNQRKPKDHDHELHLTGKISQRQNLRQPRPRKHRRQMGVPVEACRSVQPRELRIHKRTPDADADIAQRREYGGGEDEKSQGAASGGDGGRWTPACVGRSDADKQHAHDNDQRDVVQCDGPSFSRDRQTGQRRDDCKASPYAPRRG